VTREQAIVEFAKLVIEHVRVDGCERNRANGTEIMKALAKCLIEEKPPRQNQIEGLL
jgi:hypothetical protein